MGTVSSILAILAAIGSLLGWWREWKLRRDERFKLGLQIKALEAELQLKAEQAMAKIEAEADEAKKVREVEDAQAGDDAAVRELLNRRLRDLSH